MKPQTVYALSVLENIATLTAVVVVWWLTKSPWALVLLINLNMPKIRRKTSTQHPQHRSLWEHMKADSPAHDDAAKERLS